MCWPGSHVEMMLAYYANKAEAEKKAADKAKRGTSIKRR
jgi:hypothetical protein